MRVGRLTVAVLAFVAALLTPVLSGAAGRSPFAQTYTFVDLGDPGSGPEASAAWDVNGAGQVVGASTTEVFGATHAFLWDDGELRDLGTLDPGSLAASAAYGIDEAGRIVGQTHVDLEQPPHAFLYRRGRMRDLGTGFGASSFSRAWDINGAGQIVGERSRTQSSPVRAFLLRKGRFRSLGTLGGRSQTPFGVDSIAYAVNENGQIVGTALPPTPPLHAFLWKNGAMRDLGTLGGNGEATEAFDVNDAAQIVGASPTRGGRIHAFLWQAGAMLDLGTLGGSDSGAYGINVNGSVVGGSRTPTSPPNNAGHAFLWRNGRMLDLNELVTNLPANVVLEVAQAIADDGSIVGTTCTSFCEPGADAPTHGYLLIPS